MDPSKQLECADAASDKRAAAATDADNQCDDDSESKDVLVKKGAVGRRFAVVTLPAALVKASDECGKSSDDAAEC